MVIKTINLMGDDMMELFNGDCLKEMGKIKDQSINTIITSPPYAKQRDYIGAESSDYLKFISPIFEKAMLLVVPDGSLFINIKEHCKDGQRDLYVHKMIIHFVEDLNFIFVDEYIWCKTNPFPTGAKNRLKDGYERVLHFTKNKNHCFYPENVLVKSKSKWLKSEKKRKNKGAHKVNNNSGMNMSKRISSDMVRPSNVLTGTSSNTNIDHPAVFPVYLPEFFIKLTTKENERVLDPFMGSGTTGIACANLNRFFVGIELDKKYFDLSKNRIRRSFLEINNKPYGG